MHTGPDLGRQPRLPGWARKLLLDLGCLLLLLFGFCVLYILGDLLFYGTVKW
jgi:hypothetical protein